MSKNTQQKLLAAYDPGNDTLQKWKDQYMEVKIKDDRSRNVERKIDLQLQRFVDFLMTRYGLDKVTTIVQRTVKE